MFMENDFFRGSDQVLIRIGWIPQQKLQGKSPQQELSRVSYASTQWSRLEGLLDGREGTLRTWSFERFVEKLEH